jgi:hypothetical protein
VKIATHSPAWRVFFSPLTDSSCLDPELFSDVASKNSELLATLASYWKNMSTPLLASKQNFRRFQPQTFLIIVDTTELKKKYIYI